MNIKKTKGEGIHKSSLRFDFVPGVSGVVGVVSLVAMVFPLGREARLGVTVGSDVDCWEALGGGVVGVLVADFLAGGVLFAAGGDLGLSAFRVLMMKSNVDWIMQTKIEMELV